MLQKAWQSIKISGLLGACAFTLSLPGHMLSSATYADARAYYDWVDPATVRDPVPGQFYVIDQHGTIKDPLCPVRHEDFKPQARAQADRLLVNRLGDALPLAFEAVGWFIPVLNADDRVTEQAGTPRHVLELRGIERRFAHSSSLLERNRRILAPRDLDLIEKEMVASRVAEERRLESCARAIVSSLESGLLVCQLNDVVRLGPGGAVVGVDFASRCLARAIDTEPRKLPDLDRGSFLSGIKHGLGLLEEHPLPAASATGQI